MLSVKLGQLRYISNGLVFAPGVVKEHIVIKRFGFFFSFLAKEGLDFSYLYRAIHKRLF